MSSLVSSAEDLISRVNSASPENRIKILTELFNAGKELQDLSSNLEKQLGKLKKEISDANAIKLEFRSELRLYQEKSSDSIKALAVAEYRLSEAEKTIESLKTNNPGISSMNLNLNSKSELYRIDEKFIGEDRTLYPAFQKQIRIALAQNSDRYISLQSQITLIYQNLGIGPKSFLDRYLQDDGLFSFKSLSEVWNVLDVSFRNPNEEEDARDALSRLRQGNKPFGAYLSEFQRLQNLSCISDDKTLIAYMRSGLSQNLNLCIGQQQLMDKVYNFDEFVKLCKECVIRLDWMRPSIRGARSPILPDLTPRSNYPTQPVAVLPIRNPMSNPSSGSNSVPLGGDPMILDNINVSHIGPDGHITPEERLRRFQLKLCMRCGKPGHRANNCRKNNGLHQIELDDTIPIEKELKD